MRRSPRFILDLALSLIATVVGPVLLGIALLACVPAARTAVLRLAIIKARASIPGQLTLGRASWRSLGRIELENVLWIDPPDTLARVSRLAVRVDLARLVRRDVHLRELTASGLRADLVAVRARFYAAPEGTLAKKAKPRGFPRQGSLPGAPSIGFDRIDIDAPFVRIDTGTTVRDFQFHGSLDLLQGSRPAAAIEQLRFFLPEQNSAIEDAAVHLDLQDAGRLEARGSGRIGEEWPFHLSAVTEDGGRWRLTLLRDGPAGAATDEGIEATGSFRREGRRLAGLTLDASVHTPGTRTLSRFPSLGRAFAGLPDLEGLRARARGEMSFRDGTSGALLVDFERNGWMTAGSASVAFEPGRVDVDTLALGCLDLDVAGHWRMDNGTQDGSVVAHARGTRWMRPFVAAGSEPESLVVDLQARVHGPPDDLGITALLTGGMRRGGMRIRDLALAARGSTAPGAGVEFVLAAIAANLDVRASGDVQRDGAVQVRLDPVVLLEPEPGAPRPAIAIPAPTAQGRSGLARTQERFAPGDFTVTFDPKPKRLTVRSLRVEGDFGRGVVDGEFETDSGGSFGADISWPEAPAFLLRRIRSGETARNDLAARWASSGRIGVTANAHLTRSPSGMETRIEGSMRLPGPATLAPLLPRGAAVEDLGPIGGEFTFRTLPVAGGGWSLAANLDRSEWIESFAMRAHGAAAATVLDSLDARLLGVAVACSGRTGNGTIAGGAHVQVANGLLLQRMSPASPPAEMLLDLSATASGSSNAPDLTARFTGRISRGAVTLPTLDGELRAAGGRLTEARIHAAHGADISSVHLDSLLAVFFASETSDGALSGRLRLDARGPDLTIVHAATVRQEHGWTLDGDSLLIAVFDRTLRSQQPFELHAGNGTLTLRDLSLRGTLGTVSGEFTREGARTDLGFTADLELPRQPSWVTAPAGLWPTTMHARLVQQTGDSAVVTVLADGLQIGPRKSVRASLVLSGVGDSSHAEVVLQNPDGRFAEARGVLPGALGIVPPHFPGVDGPLYFDVALVRFPLPSTGGNPATSPGYLDRADVDRAPVLDAIGSVRGTAAAPAVALLGVITFPGYEELRDYRALAKVNVSAPGAAAPSIAEVPGMPGALAAEARAVELPAGATGLLAALRMLSPSGEVMRAGLSCPMELSLSPVRARPGGGSMEFTAESNGLPLGDLQPFMAQVRRLRGRATFRIAGRGEASNPALEGEANLSGVDLALQNGTTAAGSGKMQISGTARAPAIDGDMTVDNGSIVIPSRDRQLLPIGGGALLWEGESDVAATETDPHASRQIAERRTGSPAPGRPASIPALAQIDTIAARQAAEAETASTRAGPLANADVDVAVHVPAGIWLRGHGIDALLTGNITMVQRRGRPALLGTLRAEEGRMDIQGRRLDIERGEIVFYGDDEINPSLDLMMVRHSGEVTIHAHITGTMAALRLELSSEPDLAEADIFSYLLFDRPSDKLESGQQTALESRVVVTAQEFATSQLTTRLSRQLDLDVLSFQYSDQDSVSNSVTFGKYISPRLLVKYQQDVEQGRAFEVVLQYWLKGGFKLETHVRRTEQSGAVLSWSKEY